MAILAALCVNPVQAESAKFDISEFSVEGNTLLAASDIEKALMPFVGTNREMSDVSKAAEALHVLYERAGYSVVQVVPPVQTIADGKVLLKVVEDKIINIDVEGNKLYSAENIRASLPPLKLGTSLNAARLEAAITLANENSAKQIGVNVQPGAKLGEINTRINVTEDRLSKYVVSLDNGGSAATGYAKAGFAFQNANLFDLDHALTLQYSGSPDLIDKVYSFSGGYHIPVYRYGMSVDLIAAYSSTTTNTPGVNGNTFFAGKGTIFGTRLNRSLTSIGDLRHKVILGLDYKDTNNLMNGVPTGNITEIPLSLAYFAQTSKPGFQGGGSLSWLKNITGGANGSAANYLASRFNYPGVISATPNWRLWRLNASGAVPLPQDWQVRAQLNGQYSRDLLISAEQIGAGGAATVRGYPERVAAGDYGYVANLELYTPELGSQTNSMRGVLFWDTASVTVNDNFPANISRNTNLYSLGAGLRLVRNKDFSVKLDVGWAQKALPGTAKPVRRNDAAGHASLSYTF